MQNMLTKQLYNFQKRKKKKEQTIKVQNLISQLHASQINFSKKYIIFMLWKKPTWFLFIFFFRLLSLIKEEREKKSFFQGLLHYLLTEIGEDDSISWAVLVLFLHGLEFEILALLLKSPALPLLPPQLIL